MHSVISIGGRYLLAENATKHCAQLFEDGADIVDIGAASTGYGAKLPTQEEETIRLFPVLDALSAKYPKHLSDISIDTFHPEIAAKAIDYGVGMINDVKGGKNDLMLEIIASYPDVSYVMMCNTVVPANRDHRMHDIEEIIRYGEEYINKALKFGVKKEQIIFDPGIGFATGSNLSLYVIKNIEQLKSLGLPIYIGHSRKSFLTEQTEQTLPQNRDIQTAAVSSYLLTKEIDYLRVHNVKMHNAMFKILNRILSC